MTATLRTFAFTAIVLAIAGVSTTASAQIRSGIRLYPGPIVPETPRLGITGHFHFSHGMEVESVVYGSPAYRMGLEPGDHIRSINGRWLNTESDYFRALNLSHGHMRLLIEDVHTGALVSRSAYLGGHHHHDHDHHHHRGSSITLIRPRVILP
jgi:S1-C subfamily serine protease